jgi:aromatic-L-amino-acid decarboxylase
VSAPEDLRGRKAPIELSATEFREMGYALVDRIARHFDTIAERPITPAESPDQVRRLLGLDQSIPTEGVEPRRLLEEVSEALFDHSLFNGHPRFGAYITSSPAPMGVLGDFLAAAINQNVGAWKLSPLATEIEAQTVRWIAEFIGYPTDCGGLLVSGGNMANFICFLAARREIAGPALRASGLGTDDASRLRIYASMNTHTWIQKAADLFGHGTDAIRWIPVDGKQRIDLTALEARVRHDREQGDNPFLVVGTAGSVGTGGVDALGEIGAFCRETGMWFHVDGAYGALAALVEGAPADLAGLKDADSIAVDPHKWLYAPLEAGCALVRNFEQLKNAFSYHPSYYHFEEEALNYFDFGMQNSRGFRALKVWLALRQVGAEGYRTMIADDIRLAAHLYKLVDAHTEFEALSHSLSITTFRYVPPDLDAQTGPDQRKNYLNSLNADLLTRLEQCGEAFLSNALVDDKFALRMCIVNFRTSLDDIEALPGLIARLGRESDADLRKSG